MKGLHRIAIDLGLEGPRGGWLAAAEHLLMLGAEWRLEQECRVDDAERGESP